MQCGDMCWALKNRLTVFRTKQATELGSSKNMGHGGRVVTLLPPISEAGVRFPAWPQVGKLVVASVGRQFTVQNLNQLYVLVSSALPTTRRDMTCTVLKATQNPK